MLEEYRVIPGYESYGVNLHGIVVSFERDIVLSQYLLDGYLIVDTFRGSRTETLPVHRAVALAWVPNPHPDKFTIVNHRDGISLNNHYRNLEWTDYSGNNYHAVNTGLRIDNIPCCVRDFVSGEINEFMSISQACDFMGFKCILPFEVLRPKQFGRLIADRYEFRFKDDPTPWFYENRTEKVTARYQVIVTEPDGGVSEIYSNRALLKEYQLYRSPIKSIPGLVEYARSLYPEKQFVVNDSYAVTPYRVNSKVSHGIITEVIATRSGEQLQFKSLTSCARHFHVDRSTITNRLNNGKLFDGWTFTSN